MSSAALCCSSTQPYRPTRTDHEAKFASFLTWAASTGLSASQPAPASDEEIAVFEVGETAYVIQWVSQINFGPIISKRFFLSPAPGAPSYTEVPERFLVTHNFSKLNTYKNYKCPPSAHNRFFELNVYQRDPVNKHHWRADVARPGGEIDLSA